MRIIIAAVGKLKAGPERELYERYAGRVAAVGRAVALGPLELIEVPEGRAQSRDVRIADEAERLVARCGATAFRIVLDERGKALDSRTFARLLGDLRDNGQGAAALLIGGPDGHGMPAKATAGLTLSLGPLTLPHGLARVVLAEQIYRAATVLAGHPYHRD